MKAILKKYFEKTVKEDPAIAMAYNETKLSDCEGYIVRQARKYLNGKNGAIEAAVVFKWARDFMLGDVEADNVKTENVHEMTDEEFFEKEIPEYSVTHQTVVREKKPASKKSMKQKVTEIEQPSLFDFGDEE